MIFFHMKVFCVFSLESPYVGSSNEYTLYIIFNTKMENWPKLSEVCSYGIFSLGLKHKFETAMVRAIEVLLYMYPFIDTHLDGSNERP